MNNSVTKNSQSARVNEIIKQVVEILDAELGGKENYQLFLFGSRAKGQFSENADIDLALSSNSMTEKQFREIKRKVANLRTLYSVDLVHLEAVESDFRKIILSEDREINV